MSAQPAAISSSSSKTIVVFGATGNIGKPLIEELSKDNTPNSITYNILALSRDANSKSSQYLSTLPGVVVKQVPKDVMDEPYRVLTEHLKLKKGDIYGVFSVQGYVSYKQDISQGKAIADAASDLGVEHLVYLSTDFGGVDDTGTDVFECKRIVENHIKTLPIKYTFLHPAQFMDNLLPNAPTSMKMFRTLLIHNTFKTYPDRIHKMVSCRDIGRAGAIAFKNPGVWGNTEFPIASDGFVMKDLQRIYRETYNTWLTGFARNFVPTARNVADFFDKIGYSVDIEQSKRDVPGSEDLRAFLQRNKAK